MLCPVWIAGSKAFNSLPYITEMIPIRPSAKTLVLGLMCSLAVLWGGRYYLTVHFCNQVLNSIFYKVIKLEQSEYAI